MYTTRRTRTILTHYHPPLHNNQITLLGSTLSLTHILTRSLTAHSNRNSSFLHFIGAVVYPSYNPHDIILIEHSDPTQSSLLTPLKTRLAVANAANMTDVAPTSTRQHSSIYSSSLALTASRKSRRLKKSLRRKNTRNSSGATAAAIEVVPIKNDVYAPFMCDRCPNKTYQTYSSLLRHKRVECHKEPQHVCQLCSLPFYYLTTLRKHAERMHNQ